MMVRVATLILVAVTLPVAAQETAPLAQCAQVQPVVQRLLDDASARLEAARQTNNATVLRAAVDDLAAALRDVRAQLAPCANVQPATDVHAGHTTPASAAVAPVAKPPAGAVDPHAGHVMPAAPPKPAPTTKPTPGAKPPSATKPPAAAKPPADEHAGHTMPAAKAATSTAKPSTAKSSTAKPTTSKPSASKPPADEHGGHAALPPAAGAAATAVDPVCGLKVDPSSAPSTKHNGHTYYFCSPQHQQLFQKNPAKFVPKQQ